MYDYHIFIVVAIFTLLDIVTGLIQAIKNKCLQSSIGRDGIFHKSAFALAIVLAVAIEYAMVYIDLGFTIPLVIPCCSLICIIEIISICENICKINPALADNAFMELFHINTKKDDEKEE